MKSSFERIERVPPVIRLVLVTVSAIIVAAGCARITGFAESKPPAELEHGKNFLSAGDRPNAVAKFDAAVATAPKEPGVYCRIMRISARHNDQKLVEQYYRQGVEATKGLDREQQARVHLSAGEAYLVLQQYDSAIQANQKAVELVPNSYYALNGLGYSYAEADRNHARALELITQAIDIARKENAPAEMLGAIIDSLGWVYYQDDRFEEAVTTLAEAAALSPGMAEIHYHLGLAYEQTRKLQPARVALARANTIEPEMSLYRQALDRVTAALKARGELLAPEATSAPNVR